MDKRYNCNQKYFSTDIVLLKNTNHIIQSFLKVPCKLTGIIGRYGQ